MRAQGGRRWEQETGNGQVLVVLKAEPAALANGLAVGRERKRVKDEPEARVTCE